MHIHRLLYPMEFLNADNEGPISFVMGHYCCGVTAFMECRVCKTFLIIRAGYLLCPCCDCVGEMIWPPIPLYISEITNENIGRQDWTDLPPASQQP